MSEILSSNDPVEDEVENNGFWPTLTISGFKLVARTDGLTEDERIAFDIKSAMLKVNYQLRNYQAGRELEGVNEEEDQNILHHYEEAVYMRVKALLLSSYRDLDTREQGHERADRMQPRIDECYTRSNTAVNTILGKPSRFRAYEL